ncbi:MAG TPA: hypothetical protein DCL38_11165 [Lachnospiraceae bacterium]|nr:hypothetical protein [Lachnospiraceae bacterium]
MIMKKLVTSLLIMCILMLPLALAAGGEEPGGEPVVIRFGYAQTRNYIAFAEGLLDLARKMAGAGLLSDSILKEYEGVDFEETFQDEDINKLWNDICDANIPGSRYQFVREAFFDMSLMEEKDHEKMVNRDDVDIMLTMGTRPGVYFANNEKKNKFINLYAADPIASKIVKSETERYTDNAYAVVDTTPYLRQLDVGYNFLQFKKLGMVYEASETAYIYSAVKEVMQKSEEYGFEVVYKNVTEPVSEDDFDRYYRELKQAYRELIDEGMDCLYITVSSIDYETKLMELLEDAVIPAGVMTLAQADLAPLKYGALLGVTLTDSAEIAEHVFRQLERYSTEGVPFNELDMVCEVTPRIGLNITTAKKTGFDPGFKKLLMTDRIYRNKEIQK